MECVVNWSINKNTGICHSNMCVGLSLPNKYLEFLAMTIFLGRSVDYVRDDNVIGL